MNRLSYIESMLIYKGYNESIRGNVMSFEKKCMVDLLEKKAVRIIL
jgi:hypothetical protein